jgi:hypothetical protein
MTGKRRRARTRSADIFENPRIGIETRRTDAPKMTQWMGSVRGVLELHRLLEVYRGSVPCTLRPKVEAMLLAQCVAAGD